MNRCACAVGIVGLLCGCVSATDVAEPELVVVREVKPEAGVKVIDLSMEVRYYKWQPTVVCRLSAGFCASSDIKEVKESSSEVISEPTSEDMHVKRCLAAFDVLWPEGSSVVCLPGSNRLRIRNTKENHALIERAMKDLSQSLPQIEVSVDVLSVPQAELDAVGRELEKGTKPTDRFVLSDFDRISADDFRARLMRRRDVTILSSSRAVTHSGENAVVKNVVEVIYPQDYDVRVPETTTVGSQEARTVRSEQGPVVVEPQNFTMREQGLVLDVTPTLDVNGTTVDLALKVQSVGEPNWNEFGMRPPASGGTTYDLPMKQPFFPVQSIDGRMSVRAGAAALVGSYRTATPGGGEGPLRLVFVRTRLR